MRVTAEQKDATRRTILKVAQEQFAARGFDASTTRDIASAAGIAAGTLFNYFPTKEAIVECLVTEAHALAAEKFANARKQDEPRSLEEELFTFVAAVLRKLGPYRRYLPAILETALSPLAAANSGEARPLRTAHLETVVQIVSHHGCGEALTTLAVQIYWTLFIGVLTFWANDSSPRQEDTLALLDQSLAMFVGWLAAPGDAPNQETGG